MRPDALAPVRVRTERPTSAGHARAGGTEATRRAGEAQGRSRRTERPPLRRNRTRAPLPRVTPNEHSNERVGRIACMGQPRRRPPAPRGAPRERFRALADSVRAGGTGRGLLAERWRGRGGRGGRPTSRSARRRRRTRRACRAAGAITAGRRMSRRRARGDRREALVRAGRVRGVRVVLPGLWQRCTPTVAKRVISDSADGASSVFAADAEGDGDLDVLSASSYDDTVAWFENVDGLGSFSLLRGMLMRPPVTPTDTEVPCVFTSVDPAA